MADNSFADMLLPGEVVEAQLAGEGRTVERGHGVERTWWQVALTQERLLVIRMKQAAGTDRWDVLSRIAGARANVSVGHFPRTAADTARLTLDGVGDRIVYIDADKPPLLPQVRAFLAVWDGPVSGADTVSAEEIDAYHGDAKDQKPLIYMALAMLGLFILCCGCLGVAGVLRQVLAYVFGV